MSTVDKGHLGEKKNIHTKKDLNSCVDKIRNLYKSLCVKIQSITNMIFLIKLYLLLAKN